MKSTAVLATAAMSLAAALCCRAADDVAASASVAAPERKQRDYLDVTWWDPYVENITDTDTYLRRKFRQDVTDRTTGVDYDGITNRLEEIVAAAKASGESWRVTKAKCTAAEILEQSIDVSPLDWFPAISIWNRRALPVRDWVVGVRRAEINERMLPEWVKREWDAGIADGTWRLSQDYDHSVPTGA